jgi:hypothetical protein
MKRIIPALAIVLTLTGVSAAADSQGPEKDWCLLGVADKCSGTTTLALPEKTRRLEAAIKQGTAVYTPEELKHLQAMLDEARQIKMLLDKR